MKVLLIYDSRYGNTEKIAHAVGEGLSTALEASGAVDVVGVADAQSDHLAGLDLLVVGGPTHGSHPSELMRGFLDRIPEKALAGIKVAAFDTRTDMDTLTGAMRVFGRFLDRLGYAAPRIAASLEKKGGQVVAAPEGFIVKGTEGPLEEGELERAAEWGKTIGGEH